MEFFYITHINHIKHITPWVRFITHIKPKREENNLSFFLLISYKSHISHLSHFGYFCLNKHISHITPIKPWVMVSLPDPRGASLHEAFQILSVRPYVHTKVCPSPFGLVLSYGQCTLGLIKGCPTPLNLIYP